MLKKSKKAEASKAAGSEEATQAEEAEARLEEAAGRLMASAAKFYDIALAKAVNFEEKERRR